VDDQTWSLFKYYPAGCVSDILSDLVKTNAPVPQSLAHLFTHKLEVAVKQLISNGLEPSRVAAVVKPDLIFIVLQEDDLEVKFKYA